MNAILFDSTRPVKSGRPFGRGNPSVHCRPFVPTLEDLDWAAEFFGDLEDARRLEEQALEATWYDQFNDSIPQTGHCLNCGDRCDDLTIQGLCDGCDDLATNATIAGQNGRAGLGYRVF